MQVFLVGVARALWWKILQEGGLLGLRFPKDGPLFFGGGLGLSTGGIAWKVPRRARIEVELTVITLLQESFRVL